MDISFIMPSRNNLKYLKWSYASIRKHQRGHNVQICVADDNSTDGTWEWCIETMKSDPEFNAIRNDSGNRMGHTILYDVLVNDVAKHDICLIWHCDMYLCPGTLNSIEKHIKPKTIVSLTRIEPPLHPKGPEKIILDCGLEPEDFDEDKLLHMLEMEYEPLYQDKSTTGIFAPWAFFKKDFIEIGGHDQLFAPQSKEDSDIFNRFKLNGCEFIQTWEGFVYHMTCRGSRYNPTLTNVGIESAEWLKQNEKSSRNFARKWGHDVMHDMLMDPIIPPKFNITINVENATLGILWVLEPYCTTISCDNAKLIEQYIESEQANTDYDLSARVLHVDKNYTPHDFMIVVNAKAFARDDLNCIRHMGMIIEQNAPDKNSTFQLGNLKIISTDYELPDMTNLIKKDYVATPESILEYDI